MNDDQEPLTEEERLREEARAVIAHPPEKIPDAAELPHDVRDGNIEDID